MFINFIILAITFGCGFIIVGYEVEARRNGWSIGQWMSGDASFMKIFAFITMVTSLGISFSLYEWWTPFVVFFAGFIFGFIASQILKSLVQVLAVVGAIVGWVLCLVYVL